MSPWARLSVFPARWLALGLLGLVSMVLWEPTLAACPVCFGEGEGAAREGLGASMLFLVGWVYGVMVILGWVITRARTRAAAGGQCGPSPGDHGTPAGEEDP